MTYIAARHLLDALHALIWCARLRFDRERRQPAFPRRQSDCLAIEAERIGLRHLADAARELGIVVSFDPEGYPICPCLNCHKEVTDVGETERSAGEPSARPA